MKRFFSLGEHRKLEGWPLLFTVLTTLAILVGTVVEFAPIFLIESPATETVTVRPFTPLELVGRDIYIREGCVGCHSQMVRPFRHEIERYGDYGTERETIYERPFLWGSKRTGPDLARLGGKYPHLWHVRHMEDPRSTSPASIMPPYPWLLTRDVDYSNLPRRIEVLQSLGHPYSDDVIADAVGAAQAQAETIAADIAAQGGPDGLTDKEIVALVAYLQSLGVAPTADAPTADEASRPAATAGSARPSANAGSQP